MNAINKVESTKYSDILNYLFNKALKFSKVKGAVQMWVPSSEMKLKDWGRQEGANLQDLFKRLYDDNSVNYQGEKAVIEFAHKYKGKPAWKIDLDKVPDIRLARKVVLSKYWKSDKIPGMDSNNWKQHFDQFFTDFKRNFNPFHTDDQEGGVADVMEFPINEVVDGFMQYYLPDAAIGDETFVRDFKGYLKTKYNIDLPPEVESNLYHGDFMGWKPVDTSGSPMPLKEYDPEAPSFEDLKKWFKWDENDAAK